MKGVVGVSAFGLKDCFVQAGTRIQGTAFYPTTVVLPTSPFARIITGDEACKERTHSGLHWPPEARIQFGEPVRRCPIAAVWKSLVEAGDRMVRWDAGRGVSFSLARILASHIKGLLTGKSVTEKLLLRDSKGEPALAIAIPDNLDEFGQELLLRELSALGYPESFLVWRPIAAALSWLDKVENELTQVSENDHIHVIYFGPDALEFTSFRLRVKFHNNRHYILPRRDRPKVLPPWTGLEWAGRLIEDNFKGLEDGAFWQALIQFPEIWQAIAGQKWNLDDIPRPWSRGQEWTIWNPSSDIFNHVYDTKVSSCVPLSRILEKSNKLYLNNKSPFNSIKDLFQKNIHRMASLYAGGRLRGMILCGPLFPGNIPPWLFSTMELLTERGLKITGNLADPKADQLWLSSGFNDPVSDGASIFGQRMLAGIPSYLDTMPQISILASESGHYTWVPLLNAQEVWGGEEHKDKIERRFQLDEGKRNLNVYLYKGSVEDAPLDSMDYFKPQAKPPAGVTTCRARLVREIVHRHGSLKKINNQAFFKGSSKESIYGKAYAEALFMPGNQNIKKSTELPPMDTFGTPLRRAVFDFPSAPEHDTVLDVEVRIRPASGLARIEILPEDASFLQGERVRLNYSTMRFASKLPRRMRGWPRIEEIVVDPEDGVLLRGLKVVDVFENSSSTSRNYTWIIDNVRGMINGNILRNIAGLNLYLKAVDQDGKACTNAGNEILQRIALKFENDFRQLQDLGRDTLIKRVFVRAAWLYASAPSNIVIYIRNILPIWSPPQKWNWAVESASRVFVDLEDFKFLFHSIAKRAESDPSDERTFPGNAARSICNVLMFRKDGERGLNRNMAQLFAHRALQRLLKEQHAGNFNMIYFQMIRLLLYLLRYRRTDPSCFDPNVPQSVSVFEEAKKSMGFAVSSLPTFSLKARKIQKIIEGFDRYLHYEGTEDVISVLRDLAESDLEDDTSQ